MLDYYLDAVSQKVLIRAKAASPANPANPALVNATIDLTKLNRSVDGDPKVSDRRVMNRTSTWNAAVQMATVLSRYYAVHQNVGDQNQAATLAAADPAIIILKRQIIAAALAAGFWSVWMTVFSTTGTFINDTVRGSLLKELFVDTFPGTRYP
jgi:hypothetical protein